MAVSNSLWRRCVAAVLGVRDLVKPALLPGDTRAAYSLPRRCAAAILGVRLQAPPARCIPEK